jgi:predicted enzyme related to lactoylglutathione lyase
VSETDELPVGLIGWCDLTVKDAEGIRDFYQQTVGWQAGGIPMGGYDDFIMIPPGSEEAAAGICHARGANADLPAQWLVYIVVEDVEASADRCHELGGEVVSPPRAMGGGRVCVIKDPAGAVCALWTPAS